MPFTDWKPANSQGILPLEDDADEFRYRRFLEWEVPLFSFGIGERSATGKWKIRIYSPSDTLLFEQEVQITLTMVSLGAPVAIQFFTWWIKSEKILTTRVGGEPITENNPAWKYTIGGTPFSEFGILAPGGGSSYTDGVALVSAEWQSTVYEMNVPEGSRFEVVFDNWGLGVSSRPEWQWSFKYGSDRIVDCKVGPLGEMNIAYGTPQNNMFMSHSWPEFKYNQRYNYIPNLREPSLAVFDNGKQILMGLQEDGLWEYESVDYWRTYKKVGYAIEGEFPGDKYPEKLFGPDVVMPQMIHIDNVRIFLVLRGTDILVRRVYNNELSGPVKVGSNIFNEFYALDALENGDVVIVGSSDGVAKFVSKDKGLTFLPVEPLNA